MGKLIYSMRMSMGGYVEDEHGRFGWGAPDDQEVHGYINQLASRPAPIFTDERCTGQGSIGRPRTPSQPAEVRARRGAAVAGGREIVYSRTLAEPRSTRTRAERESPRRRAAAQGRCPPRSDRLTGPRSPGQALRAGIVDEPSAASKRVRKYACGQQVR